jgi:hypothetical protein
MPVVCQVCNVDVILNVKKTNKKKHHSSAEGTAAPTNVYALDDGL